jgi:hypothetical protein
MAVYFITALAVWAPASLLLRRVTGPADRIEQVVGGLFVAVGWPVTMVALSASVLAKRRSAHVSAPDASLGSLPHRLPPEPGRSHGPIRSMQDVRGDDPSASEGHVRRGRVASALLEAPPRDHARGTLDEVSEQDPRD